jgi:hypothetical protein
VERKWWTLLASCIAIFMLLLDVTIVNVALPSIERELGANFSDIQWVIDAYALTLAGFVLAAGSLADMVGRRLVFMLGLAIFAASSLACGLAPDPLFLNLSRAAQGIGGAMMFGTSLALIAQEFKGRERGTALASSGSPPGLLASVRSFSRRSSRRSPHSSRARPRRRTSTSFRGLWRQAGPAASCRRCRPPTATRWCTPRTKPS